MDILVLNSGGLPPGTARGVSPADLDRALHSLCKRQVEAVDCARAAREATDLEQVREASRGAIPAGRYGRPEEFAAVVAFLCSGAACYVTGEQVRCDGSAAVAY